MAVPYDLFVRFLVTKGLDDLKEVNVRLEELSLPEISQKTFDTQYNLVTNNVPAGVLSQIQNGRYDPDFLNWMNILEVADLWYFEKAFTDTTKKPIIKLVYDIHQDFQIRLVIDALLIKKASPLDIVQSINIKFSALLQEAHISIYTRFFFDPCRMTRADWKAYLTEQDGDDRRIYFLALTEPLEIVKSELELPAKVNVCDSIQFLLSKSTQKAKQYLKVNSKEGNFEARLWIDTVIKLSDKYEKYRSGDTDDFSKTLQLKFQFVESDFSHPDDETVKELKTQFEKSESPYTSKDKTESINSSPLPKS